MKYIALAYTRRHEVPELVFQGARAYQTGRRIIRAFEKRAKIETFLPDSSVEEIVNDLIGSIGSSSEPSAWCLLKKFLRPTRLG